ncbi:uncharacterized protein [Chelonus insularis]|uniref:uncharacterized protein n=1 Tax=Chelonus insularis TaxID=460826 RepID=UPI00158D8437|nr:uncharacterized protein LOC118065679 [Chelonus insularis]XP_034937005.1 uncharacterized protein LOC118065679 [Chelonus insularis]
MKSPLKRHYYCSSCFVHENENDNESCSCETASLSYFLQIPIVNQLQSLLLRPNFLDDLNKSPTIGTSTVISDIYNGEMYKNYTDDSGLLAHRKPNISFMFYTNGAPAFKYSKCKVWPIYLIIDELPYNKKILKENIIVAGIWFDPENPNPNLFLQPLHTEIVQLRRKVFFQTPETTVPITIKALLICGTCDIPAKADFLNHSHHNGFYGCTLCYSSDYNISGTNFGNTHVYPFDGPLKLRTVDEHRQDVEEAFIEQERIFGVKGPSLLFSIMPNAINGMFIDTMHCVFNGVVSKLVHLWFDTSLRYERFSLHANKAIVDNYYKSSQYRLYQECPAQYRILLVTGKQVNGEISFFITRFRYFRM